MDIFSRLLRERIIFLKQILDSDGVFVIRLDYHFGHYLRVLLDEIFGAENFINDIIINRFKRQQYGLTKFNIGNDYLFAYSKSTNYTFQEQIRGRICSFCGAEKEPEWHQMISSGLRNPPERIIQGRKMLPPRGQHWKYIQEKIDIMDKEGRIRIDESRNYTDLEGNKINGMPEYLQTEHSIVDNDWTDLRGYVLSKRYPTENHEELLERVINTFSSEGDLILDAFAGSGTTGAVGEKLGRKCIMCDFGKHAIYVMQARLLEISKSKEPGDSNKKFGKDPNPFCVVSVGAYDFQRIMNLRENKEAYVKFVLSLFGITDIADKYSEKYKLTNIYAQKDGNPVEVYPIWEDEYLKEVKIDEDYLNGIIQQYRGNLKGKYYIAAPETCDVVGDTKIGDAEFVLLTFPYKILEEASRNFQLTEQAMDLYNAQKRCAIGT